MFRSIAQSSLTNDADFAFVFDFVFGDTLRLHACVPALVFVHTPFLKISESPNYFRITLAGITQFA